MRPAVRTLDAPLGSCEISIAIPARNEALVIASALDALAEQRTPDGRAVAPERYEVIVLANGCTDETQAVVLDYARAHPQLVLHLVTSSAAERETNVGTARRSVLDIAAERQGARNGRNGIIATTDADSIVDSLWIARTFEEMRGVDAVAGTVGLSDADRSALPSAARDLYDHERTYRGLLGDLEATVDPVPHDPPRRHASFVGASFAVRVDAYASAGGLPMLPTLEDQAFSRALARNDARIRHSYAVRVETSPRCLARVEGGFGTFLASLIENGERRQSFRVEHPERSFQRVRARALLRRFYYGRRTSADAADLAARYGTTADSLSNLLQRTTTFGSLVDRLERRAPFEALPDVPVELAIDALSDVSAFETTPLQRAE